MKKRAVHEADTGALQLQSIRWMLHAAYRFSRPTAGRLCYRVLARPPRKDPNSQEALFLAKADRTIMPVGRMNIGVFHWPGKGPKVLLAHGWNSHSGRWQPLAQQLHDLGYDIYAMDAPAHGESTGGSFALVYYAQAMTELVNSIQPQTIIGHSAGGMAAIYYLHHEQEATRPDRLVLLATPAELSHFMDSFQRIIGLKNGVMDALEREFLRRFNRGFGYYSTADFIERLELPGLIIHDDDDDVAPVAGAHTLDQRWNDGKLLVTQGLGHSIQSQMVDEFILNWLDQQP